MFFGIQIFWHVVKNVLIFLFFQALKNSPYHSNKYSFKPKLNRVALCYLKLKTLIDTQF